MKRIYLLVFIVFLFSCVRVFAENDYFDMTIGYNVQYSVADFDDLDVGNLFHQIYLAPAVGLKTEAWGRERMVYGFGPYVAGSYDGRNGEFSGVAGVNFQFWGLFWFGMGLDTDIDPVIFGGIMYDLFGDELVCGINISAYDKVDDKADDVKLQMGLYFKK